LILASETRTWVFDGKTFHVLLPYLDGKHSIAEIQRKVSNQLSLSSIVGALHQLEVRDCLADGVSERDASEASFFDHVPQSQSPVAAYRRSVSIVSLSRASAEELRDGIRDFGFVEEDPADLTVVLVDDYLQPELGELNAKFISENRMWMPIKPTGTTLWLGPIFHAGRTGCWECMAQRLRSNRQVEKYLLSHVASEILWQGRPKVEIVARIVIDLALTQLACWSKSGERASIFGKLFTWDLIERQSRLHTLVKRPQCVACGKSGRAEPPQRIELKPQKKRFTEDGGHRTKTPKETYEEYSHHVSPILGAVTDLLPAVGHSHWLTPTYVAGHNFSMGLDSIVYLKAAIRGMSGGKGVSDMQAKVSGLCEAIERYSALSTGEEYRIRSTFRSLANDAIHPNEYLGFSESQFARRDSWNRSQPPSRCHLVPEPFPESEPFDWTPFCSMQDGGVKYFPTAMCYFGHPEFRIGGWCLPDSNGCASGNTLEEAILQGFMELVERDAVAIWWYNRIRRPAVDLDSFQIPYVDAIRKYYETIGRSLWVLDVSSDLPIATMACISHRKDWPTEDILMGFGSHFDPKIALLRAITEVNQFLPSVNLTNRDGSTRYLFGDDLARNWWTTARVEKETYLTPDPSAECVSKDQIPNLSSSCLAQDVGICAELVQKHKMSMYVLDQTLPDIGLSVARVLVPELCHFWRRFGKSRLFDIPVQQGWLKTATPEDQLNPHSIFF